MDLTKKTIFPHKDGTSPLEAVKDADVVITDAWTSMGHEEEAEVRAPYFKGFQVNSELLKSICNKNEE